MKISIINGPNLNLLGVREPDVYGTQSFESFLTRLRQQFPEVEIDYYQSNVEGEIINKLHEVGFSYDGIILNPAAYTHESVALHDSILASQVPTVEIHMVEVHISNIYAREEYRRHSLLSDACKGVICGLGLDGYRYALESLVQKQ